MAANAEAILKLFIGGLVWTERLEGRMAAASGTRWFGSFGAAVGTSTSVLRSGAVFGVPTTGSLSSATQPVIVSVVEHSGSPPPAGRTKRLGVHISGSNFVDRMRCSDGFDTSKLTLRAVP